MGDLLWTCLLNGPGPRAADSACVKSGKAIAGRPERPPKTGICAPGCSQHPRGRL